MRRRGQNKACHSLLGLDLDDGASLGDIDTVEEFADILVSDSGSLLDGGSTLTDVLQVISRQDNFILLVGHGNADIPEHGNAANALLSQVVADLDRFATIDDAHVDGEMGVCGAHLVGVAQGDSLDHVFDVGADGAEAGQVFAGTEPDGGLEGGGTGFGCLEVEFDGCVGEGAGQGSTGTSDGDLATGQDDLDTFRDGDAFNGVDDFHCGWMDDGRCVLLFPAKDVLETRVSFY